MNALKVSKQTALTTSSSSGTLVAIHSEKSAELRSALELSVTGEDHFSMGPLWVSLALCVAYIGLAFGLRAQGEHLLGTEPAVVAIQRETPVQQQVTSTQAPASDLKAPSSLDGLRHNIIKMAGTEGGLRYFVKHAPGGGIQLDFRASLLVDPSTANFQKSALPFFNKMIPLVLGMKKNIVWEIEMRADDQPIRRASETASVAPIAKDESQVRTVQELLTSLGVPKASTTVVGMIPITQEDPSHRRILIRIIEKE